MMMIKLRHEVTIEPLSLPYETRLKLGPFFDGVTQKLVVFGTQCMNVFCYNSPARRRPWRRRLVDGIGPLHTLCTRV